MTVSLSLVSEGLDGKLRSVGKILSWGRTRDGGGGTMSWSLRDSGPHPPQAMKGSDLCPSREGQGLRGMVGAWCVVWQELRPLGCFLCSFAVACFPRGGSCSSRVGS